MRRKSSACAKTGDEDSHGVSGILCVKAVFKISEDNPFLGKIGNRFGAFLWWNLHLLKSISCRFYNEKLPKLKLSIFFIFGFI